MKKLTIILTVFALLFGRSAFADTMAGKVENVFNAAVTGNTGNTTVSRTFNLSSCRTPMGFWLKIQKGATASSMNMQVSVMASWDDVLADFATVSTISYATSGAATCGTITFPAMKFIKFKATVLSGQATDCTITQYLFTQE